MYAQVLRAGTLQRLSARPPIVTRWITFHTLNSAEQTVSVHLDAGERRDQWPEFQVAEEVE